MDDSEVPNTKDALLLAACVAVNSLPLFMFFLFGWSILDLIFLYWAENVIIGFFIFWKILKPFKELRALSALFFLFHYGMFCYVHLVFVFSIFGKDYFLDNSGLTLFEEVQFLMNNHYLYFSVVCFFVFHLIDFVKGRSYQGFEKNFKAMMRPKIFDVETKEKSSGIFSTKYGPYNRIFVLHFTILVTAVLINIVHLHVAFGLLVLVILKIILDIHFRFEADKSVDLTK